MFDVIRIPAFKDNYIWLLRKGASAVVVDPGDATPVLAYLNAEKLQLRAILNTHHHADHVGGNAELLEHYKVPVYGPHDERIPTVTRRVGEGDGLVGGGRLQEHRELVATDAGQRHARRREPSQAVGDGAQQAVAGGVAQRLVHVAEAVQVDEDDRSGA